MINLDFYKNQDNNCYYVLNNLDSNTIDLLKNKNNDEIIKEQNPNLYYYLLSKETQNLYRWLDDIDGDILEISGGLGINTELFCQKSNTVTTLTFSKTNAEIIESRLSDYNNLEIVVGNIRETVFDKKFDYIVLTDVFEFSKAFFENQVAFIEYLKNLLKEDGSIVCTVSNRYGVGNFSGGVSHITGQAFDSINSYPKVPFLNSYTKNELNNIFSIAGFKDIDFYYPVPNHYINKIVLSDKSLDRAFIGEKVPSKYADYNINPNNLIDEKEMVKNAILNNDFTNMANSYLIIANNKNKTFYSQFANGIMTTLDDKFCTKTALNDEAYNTIKKMYEFYNLETKRIEDENIQNINYAKCSLSNNSLIMDIAEGIPLNRIALENIYDLNKFIALLTEYKSLIYKLYPKAKYQNFIIENITLENVAIAESANIDLNMSNIFKNGSDYTITDYDKTSSYIPLNYIVAQALFVLAIDSGFMINEVECLKQIGLSEREIKIYQFIYTENNRK